MRMRNASIRRTALLKIWNDCAAIGCETKMMRRPNKINRYHYRGLTPLGTARLIILRVNVINLTKRNPEKVNAFPLLHDFYTAGPLIHPQRVFLVQYLRPIDAFITHCITILLHKHRADVLTTRNIYKGIIIIYIFF